MSEETDVKFMDGKTLETVTTSDLLTEMLNNTDELKDIECVSAVRDYLDRVMILSDIDDISSTAVAHLIRFWNKADEGIDPKDRKPIKLLIDSCGGSLVGGLMIADGYIS